MGVRSRPGKGSVFSITVPVWQGPSKATSTVAGTEDDSLFSRARVLLLDADGPMRQATTRLLAPSTADVEQAATVGVRYLTRPLAPARLRAMSRLSGMRRF